MSAIKFYIRRLTQFIHDVRVEMGSASVDLGWHDETQRKELAAQLREAADELDPRKDHAPDLVAALQDILSVDVMSPEGGHEAVAEIHCMAREALKLTGVEE